MSIAITEIRRAFRYNGILLPDVPGLEPREVRDLYSAQYPELISAEVESGEVSNGMQEFTFRKAVGTKGAATRTTPVPDAGETPRLATLRARLDGVSAPFAEAERLSRALSRPAVRFASSSWARFAQSCQQRQRDGCRDERVCVTSDMLAPLP